MTTTTKKKSSKRTTKKTTARKGTARKKKTTARKTGTARKKSSKKKTSARKKTSTKTTATKRTAPPSMPKGSPVTGHEINGVQVVTADGRKPGKRGAQGYVEGSRIKKLKVIQELRSGGIGDITDLMKSVRVDGLIEPLVVRPAGDGENFELIAGERRHTAAKAVGGKTWENVPVIIRMDLTDDDDRAIAVAVAENSPDGRSNLNVVDIGRQAIRLQKKKWSPERMAKEFGLGIKTLRRALQVMDTSPTIQEKVREGELSMTAALEVHQLPPQMQKELEETVGPGTTAADIRRERKKLEAAQDKEQAAKGKSTEKTTTKGKPKVKLTTAWKSPSDKKAQLGAMCESFHTAEEGDIGTGDWYEMRGAIAYALWDRGDLETPFLPSAFEEEMENPSSDKKVNALFTSIVGNEAARFSSKKS